MLIKSIVFLFDIYIIFVIQNYSHCVLSILCMAKCLYVRYSCFYVMNEPTNLNKTHFLSTLA